MNKMFQFKWFRCHKIWLFNIKINKICQGNFNIIPTKMYLLLLKYFFIKSLMQFNMINMDSLFNRKFIKYNNLKILHQEIFEFYH